VRATASKTGAVMGEAGILWWRNGKIAPTKYINRSYILLVVNLSSV
jgi:hypothetical protein